MGLADDQHVIVLNEGDVDSALFVQRTRRSGKTHVTVELKTEPIAFTTDPVALGQETALAIRDVLYQRIRDISEVVSDATIRRRQVAKRALERGEDWATERYSGGRTGTKTPAQTVRYFNDSGRMAEGLHVQQNLKDETFTINVPVNRLNPTSFPGGTFDAMLSKLRSLVPELQDVKRLLADQEVHKAIEASIRKAMVKGQPGVSAKGMAEALKRFNAFCRTAAAAVKTLSGG